ncbi:RHS repeat protein [Flagellimonas sp. 389]|uniref:RHS repeat domain-containing protein n=1 Tax=Flagellimonas sp. 389 TaxID=2835862 RepID=UPI001BD5F352|nr:RHS repeat domain-containing protein [Flagellimonas sp. 389]MBS9461421.1 RHS repeat protein [Flagellimonas sp. 389]
MKKTFYLFALLTLVFSFNTDLFSQGYNPLYIDYYAKVLPSTPNAGTFTIYGDIPVDNSTGIPQIEIPLFTLIEDGVSVPISISYHALGIKVDQLASAVGLNWTLNAGGGIFRQVNDKNDEIGWLHPNGKGTVNPNWIASQGGLDDYLVQKQIRQSDETQDYYPDDFNYSFGGKTGDFIFDANGVLTMEEDTDIRVEKIGGVGQLIHFKAFDGEGNTYFFDGDKEYNTQNVVVGGSLGSSLNFNSNSYTASWMLDRITTRNNKQITFTYQLYSLSYTVTDLAHSIVHVDRCKPVIPVVSVCGCLEEGSGTSTSLSTTSIVYSPQNKLPHIIESTTVKITFNYLDDSSLSTWKRKLASIQILDKLNSKTKSFVFSYGKYGGDPRLRLDELQEIGFDGVPKPAYKFYYNNGNLPNKGNTGKDDFGYYNGENNSTLIPFTPLAQYTLNNVYTGMLGDRSFNNNYLQRGVLNKIIYPTGGSSSFNYEPNAIAVGTTSNPTFSQKSVEVSNQIYSTNITSGFNTLFRVPFTVVSNVQGILGTSVSYSGSSDICAYDPNFPNIDCSTFNIYPRTGTSISGPAILNPDKIIWADGSLNLQAGDYMLELKVKTSQLNSNPNALIRVGLSWMDEDDPEVVPTFFYAGGLRVKRKIDQDVDGSMAKKTVYNYEDLIGYGIDYDNFNKPYGGRDVFSSNNLALNPALIKSGHFYKKVTIDVVGGTDTLRTVEHFDHKFRNKSYASQIVRQEQYRGSKLVQSVDMEYANTTTKTLFFWTLGDRDYCYQQFSFPPSNVNMFLGYNNPNNTVYTHRRNVLQKRTEIHYDYEDPEPFNAIVKVKKFQYNNNMRLTTLEEDGRFFASNYSDIVNNNFSFDSNGEHIVTNHTYPYDHIHENGAMAAFLSDNYGLQVSKRVFNKSNMVLGQTQDFDNEGNVVATYRFNKGIGSNNASSGHIPLNYELFETYGLQNGRLVEIKRYNGSPTTLIWDVTGTYVIASVQNASLSQINALPSFPGTFTAISGLTVSQENELRGLSNTLVTTYKYDPLLGIKSVTDPTGYTVHYEYDGLGRLKAVKDHNGDYVSENRYHYKGQ